MFLSTFLASIRPAGRSVRRTIKTSAFAHSLRTTRGIEAAPSQNATFWRSFANQAGSNANPVPARTHNPHHDNGNYHHQKRRPKRRNKNRKRGGRYNRGAVDYSVTPSERREKTQNFVFTIKEKIAFQNKLSFELNRDLLDLFFQENDRFFEEIVKQNEGNIKFLDFSALTGYAIRGEKWKYVIFLFEAMQNAGFHPSALNYRSLISVLGKMGQWQAALEHTEAVRKNRKLKGMGRLKVYHAAVIACVENQKLHHAIDVLENVVEERLYEQFDCTALLTQAASKCVHNRRSAQRMLVLLESAGVKLAAHNTLQIYRNIIRYHDDYDEIERLCCEAAELYVNPGLLDDHTRREIFAAGMQALGKSGQVSSAVRLLQVMEGRCGVAPDTTSFAAIIEACARSGDTQLALATLTQVEQSSLKPDLRLLQHAIQACGTDVNRNNVAAGEKAIEIFTSLSEYGLSPTDYTFNSIICTCCDVGMVDKALHFVEEMKMMGLLKDPIAFTNLIVAYGRVEPKPDWQSAIATFNRLEEEGIQADVFAYDATIRVCAAAQEIDPVIQVVQHLGDSGISPNGTLKNNLKWSLRRFTDLEKAGKVSSTAVETLRELVQQMVTRG